MATSDAEYIAANFAGCEAMWLRQLLTELRYHVHKLTIYCDGQPAIAVSKNPECYLVSETGMEMEIMCYMPETK